MDTTEEEFKELTGTGIDGDDAATLTEVDEPVIDDEELPVEVDPALADPEDEGAFGGEEDSDEAEVAAYMYQDYEER